MPEEFKKDYAEFTARLDRLSHLTRELKKAKNHEDRKIIIEEIMSIKNNLRKPQDK